MPLPCAVCTLPPGQLEAANLALIAGVATLDDLAARFGVGRDSLHEHRHHHLPAEMVAAHEAEQTARADVLLGQVQTLHTQALEILSEAREAGKYDAACSAIREARRCVELLLKVAGEIDDRPQVSILLNPQFLQVQAVILRALEKHPEALEAVRGALSEAVQNGQ